ncbi:MAG: hypothetical protein JKY52_07805 [Flavobacteriales bacterium]|nr:hypothetical protein [Flavobacteriales bacterium]
MTQQQMGKPCMEPIRLGQEKHGLAFSKGRHRGPVGVPVVEDLVLEEEVLGLENSLKKEK